MAESRSASPEKNGAYAAADYDSADRERALAEQLRRCGTRSFQYSGSWRTTDNDFLRLSHTDEL